MFNVECSMLITQMLPPPSSARLTPCRHCGTPFRPQSPEDAFCCHGCRYVSQVICDGGLERFYDLKGDRSVPPVGSRVFQVADAEWLDTLQQTAETQTGGPAAEAELGIEGISCIGCVWLIEAILKQQPGAASIRILPRDGRVRLAWRPGAFSLAEFARAIQRLGYRLSPYDTEAPRRNASRQLVNRIGLCAFFLLNTMLFTLPGYLGMAGDFFLAPLFQLLGAAFATLSLIVGGGYFIQRAASALRRGVLHIDLPIALGLVAAYAGSLIGWASGYLQLVYFDFVATFVFLMLVGRWLQEVALERNRAHMRRRDFGPKEVTLFGGAKDGRTVPVDQIKAGQTYTVAPGAINPVAADLLDDAGTLSLEWIDGEAEPVHWPRQKTAPAGAINLGLAPLSFRSREAWPDSLLAQLLVRPEDDFRNRRLQSVLKAYIGVVLALAALGGLGWLAATGDVLKSTQVLISILVVSCPCALGVALPMCDEFANARLRRVGLFVKTAEIWERLRRVRTVVFDKTGTLTMDAPRLTNPSALKALERDALRALRVLIRNNPHPVARSLRENLVAARIDHQVDGLLGPQHSLRETVGQGVAWTDPRGTEWTLGKPTPSDPHPSALRPQPSPHTLLARNGIVLAAFQFEEDVRDDAREAVDYLRHQNLDTALLSGDADARVQAVAAQLDLDPGRVRSTCGPRAKADWIRANAPNAALMVGDGANDSLAFDEAVCRGTPVVDRSILEASADFFFFGRSLSCLPVLFDTARFRHITVGTVFAAALVYNVAAVGLCLAGLMHPLLAAILMPLSSIATLLIAWAGLGRR